MLYAKLHGCTPPKEPRDTVHSLAHLSPEDVRQKAELLVAHVYTEKLKGFTASTENLASGAKSGDLRSTGFQGRPNHMRPRVADGPTDKL